MTQSDRIEYINRGIIKTQENIRYFEEKYIKSGQKDMDIKYIIKNREEILQSLIAGLHIEYIIQYEEILKEQAKANEEVKNEPEV